MTMVTATFARTAGCALFLAALLVPRALGAHCDTLDGPVVTEARSALENGDVTPVLKWVRPEDEPEIRTAFTNALAARKLGAEARLVADRYFFETLVRVHRAGEGAPFTGLAPAGSVEPAIAAADRALAQAAVDPLVREVSEAVATGIRARFQRALAAKKDAGKSVDAGREYVEAYVEYIHYVERLHSDASTSAGHHEGVDGNAAAEHEHR
jgi:uncharacterized protein DUF6448